MAEKLNPLPKVPDLDIEEHGISIPAPMPAATSVPNPWRPQVNGNAPAPGQSDNGSDSSSTQDE